MLSLKALSCIVVIYFELVQSKCIQNILLSQVLQSNMNTLEKLSAVNKIALNGHNVGKDFQLTSSSDWPYNIPNPNLDQSNTQFQTLPTEFEPWVSLGNPKQSIYQRDRVQSPLPWSALASNQQSSGPIRYQLPTWNPLMDTKRPFSSYPNQYQPPQNVYNMDLYNSNNPTFLNLQSSLYNQDRSNSYDAQRPGMEPSWSSQLLYSNPLSQRDSSPSTLENYSSNSHSFQQYEPKNPLSSLSFS